MRQRLVDGTGSLQPGLVSCPRRAHRQACAGGYEALPVLLWRGWCCVRIMLTSHGYPPTISGVTLVVQRLARAMVARGHSVTVLAGSDLFRPYESLDRGVKVIRLESRRNPYWPANPVPVTSLETLQDIVARERPDVIHAHDALPFLLQLARARDSLDAQLVATCHYYPDFVASYLVNGEISRELVENLTWRYTIRLYNHVPTIVFATATHRRDFVSHGLASHAHIISNGINIMRYHPGTTSLDVSSRYGVGDGPRILAVGRLAKDKDLEVLIRALAHGPLAATARLMLVGEGPHRDALEECAAETGVARRVHFLGFVPEEELPALYRASDLFAISSNHEVQSLPALQAAATGLPIVAADRGALAEVCHDGENGILVRTDSPYEWSTGLALALDAQTAGRMGRAGRRLARRHDERLTFDAYEALYTEMVAGASTGVQTRPTVAQIAAHR